VAINHLHEKITIVLSVGENIIVLGKEKIERKEESADNYQRTDMSQKRNND